MQKSLLRTAGDNLRPDTTVNRRYIRCWPLLEKTMNRSRSIKLGALAVLCAMLVALGAAARGDMVRIGPLVLRADGGFTPRELPQRTYVPIRFEGHADISMTNSEPPPALELAKLDFDRDGLISTVGLPVCSPGQIAGTTPTEARRICKNAIIGTGRVGAVVAPPESKRFHVESPLTLFNGPRQDGNLTVVSHAQTTVPITQTYVVVVPIERRPGYYRYRATINVPSIAGGYGALTHLEGRIGKRYRFGGRNRSYVSAKCSDGILQTRGFLRFSDGNVISGSIYKACNSVDD